MSNRGVRFGVIGLFAILMAWQMVGCGGSTPAKGTGGIGVSGTGAGDGVSAGTGGTAGAAGMMATGGAPGSGGVPGTGGTASTGGTGGTGPKTFSVSAGSNMVTPGQICARLAQIQCAGEAFCCDNPGRDKATCETAMRDGCTSKLYLDTIAMNKVSGFDAAKAGEAFNQLEMLASKCDTSIASFGASPSGLHAMLQGTVAPSMSCDQPRLNIDPAIAAAALASCTSSDTTSCLPASALSGWTCAARGDAGAKCFTDLNCKDGLYCPNPKLLFGVAMCAARKAIGTACAAANECESLFCKGAMCVTPSAQAAYCLGQ